MTASLAAPARPQTRIETDQKTGVIRFIVKGQEQALLDATGLHVRAGIFYGDSLTHYGKSGFDAKAAR